MDIISRISTSTDLDQILVDLSEGVSGHWDLAFLFMSGFDDESTKVIADQVRESLSLGTFLGCAGYGVIGPGKEVEDQAAVSLFLARLPGVRCQMFCFEQDAYADCREKEDWYDLLDVYPNEKPKFIVFTDANNTSMHNFIEGINQAYPNRPVVGALAGVENEERKNLLIGGQKCFDRGVVGVCLVGDIHIETIVSQGCRPIGDSFIVTGSEENVIYELAGRPFYEVLEDVLTAVPEGDQQLAQEAIFVGIAMDEYKHRMKQGDFAIRLLMAIDDETGAGVITDSVQPGQTVRFHIRDPISAELDLKRQLEHQHSELVRPAPSGILMFSCSARGKDMFGVDDHDTALVRTYFGDLPVAGFFSAGELGPVFGKNFLHGVSSTIALFYPE